MIAELISTLLLLLAPEIGISWIERNNQQQIQMTLQGGEDIIDPCILHGLELRLKYEVKSCTRRKGWIDTCDEPTTITRAVDFDPIGERFRVRYDIRGDDKDPEEVTVLEQETAVSMVRVVPSVAIDETVNGRTVEYLRARAMVECRGSGMRTLERLSSFLSFGIISPPGFETRWTNFQIASEQK